MATLTMHGNPEARFRLFQSRDYEFDEAGLCGCCALQRSSTAVRWKGALCCLTFELTRPERLAGLPDVPTLTPGLSGKPASRGGSRVERGVRPHCASYRAQSPRKARTAPWMRATLSMDSVLSITLRMASRSRAKTCSSAPDESTTVHVAAFAARVMR